MPTVVERYFCVNALTAAAAALIAVNAQTANAQMYSTGPGFYLSLEGRYMWNRGDKVGSYGPITTPLAISTSGAKARADKGWGGKAMLGYRFHGNWDVGLGFAFPVLGLRVVGEEAFAAGELVVRLDHHPRQLMELHGRLPA